jgi:hypothetical protein
VRLHEYRKVKRGTMDAHHLCAGTITSIGRDMFKQLCCVVAWDNGSESMMSNDDLQRVLSSAK